MSIKPLPPDVAAQIKSSITITSLNDAICGLVKNSLDAKATKVIIVVDYSRGNCTVEDNGEGIPPAEFRDTGGLDTHGRSGTFLASLAALSLLSITSRHHGHYSQNTVKIHKSDVIARHTPSLPDQKRLASGYGTRVTVRDLFGSMPVRVKQRVMTAEKGLNMRDWDRLRHILASLALPWPSPVTISAHDSSRQQGIGIRNNGTPLQDASGSGRRSQLVSRISRVLYTAGLSEEISAESWVALKASAGGIEVSGAVCLVPVATKRMQFVSIGVQPLLSEQNSSIFYDEINKIFSNSSFGDQGDLVEPDEDQDKRIKGRRFKTDGYTNRELKGKRGIDRWPMFYIMIRLGNSISPAQGIEGFLNEGRQDLETTIDIVRAVVTEFLRRHHFRPTRIRPLQSEPAGLPQSEKARASPKKGDMGRASPASKTRHATHNGIENGSQPTTGDLAMARLHLPMIPNRSEPIFSGFAGFKSGRQGAIPRKPTEMKNTEVRDNLRHSIQSTTSDLRDQRTVPPLFGSSGSLLRPPFLDAESVDGMSSKDESFISQPQLHSPEPAAADEAGYLLWTNPITKQKSAIDSRTGFIVPTGEEPGKQNTMRPQKLRLTTKRPVQPHQPDTEEKTDTWAAELLSHWRNPIFEASEALVPAASISSGAPNSSYGPKLKTVHGCLCSRDSSFASLTSVEGRISKEALREATVISQVDQKFIFAKVPLQVGPTNKENAASLLVVVDQHAADERCRVEALMDDYFHTQASDISQGAVARTELLDQALQFEITAQEHALFERYAPLGKHWGIIYEISPTTKALSRGRNQNHPSLKVTRLPSAIVERCRIEPRLLIDLLRKEIWHHAEHSNGWTVQSSLQASQRNEGREQDLHWLARFHRCPQGILDMINSRACRSAIMFNDLLSLDDCKSLLKRLADCALPFQCAHGRPSMVPLVDLGNSIIPQEDGEGDEGSFGKLLQRWKAGKQLGA
ncbi:DNA mismatch repair protein [Apiospora aurea]|uniref:DNA mismatch repair protein n=1 Tax=Apiospora aurea TaxID=335848 RepID=A0ABR1Q7R8_9PEZI